MMNGSYYQDKELFKGTAWYYARYRPPYPVEVFSLLVKKFHLDGSGSLLDLGCGPGDLAIPLASHFEKVTALDLDPDMLEEGCHKTKAAGIPNIRWVRGRAEELPPDWGPFKMVTIGKAFHWMEQPRVLELVYARLEPGGGIAIVGEMGLLWNGKEGWHSIVLAIIKKYLGQERRAGSGMAKFSGIPWETLLNQNFSKTEFHNDILERNVWSVDSLLGYLYSTSFCSRALLGHRINAFEHDLKEALIRLNPQNRFHEDITISVLMGWK